MLFIILDTVEFKIYLSSSESTITSWGQIQLLLYESFRIYRVDYTQQFHLLGQESMHIPNGINIDCTIGWLFGSKTVLFLQEKIAAWMVLCTERQGISPIRKAPPHTAMLLPHTSAVYIDQEISI